MERERAMLGKKRERGDEAVKTASRKKKKDESSHSQPNWGDNPSGLGLHLMKLALQNCNEYIMQRVQENTYLCPWIELAFGGGLNINSFVDDGIWCHLNFVAKLLVIDTTKSTMGKKGPMLLFAELKRGHGKDDYEVMSCHIIGPSKITRRSRLLGCRACNIAPFRGLIHPNRKFNLGPPLVHVPKILVADADAITTGEDQELHD